VIAGPHPSDVASLRPKLEIPSKLDPIRGMRIALSLDLGCYEVDADVAANTLAAADRLRDSGAIVDVVSLPWDLETIAKTVDIHFGMIFGASMKAINDQFSDQLTSYVRRLVADSGRVSKDDFYAGLGLEAAFYAPLGQLLEDYDALICPTFAVPALPAEYDTGDTIEVNGKPVERWLDVMMTLPFNVASRCPVLSVPSGLSANGVPTGLSIVAKTYDDVTAFRVAAAHEERLPWLTASGPRPVL
jgi:Asp-tRNA(Asn)/Glu-tRNA(Gln) amidotransferase A subunit family amidase